MESVLATARHQIQQMKERSKAELKQALEDLLEGEDGVSVMVGLNVCVFFFSNHDSWFIDVMYKPTADFII